MRYRRLVVKNFRGIEHREVHFDDGVTVVSGPNESGKSSLREAIELLRDAKDSSTAARVRNVKPVHRDAAPEVELEMGTGPYTLTYRKQWLRSPSTELHVEENGVLSHFTGGDAEQKFTKLLEDTVDFGLLKELDVKQGSSLIQPELANITALHQALGDSPQPEAADTLMAAVEAEYLRYFTRSGQPSKEMKAADQTLKQVEAEHAEVEARYLAVEALTEEFQENRKRIVSVRKQLGTAQEKLQGALDQQQQVLTLQEIIDTQETQVQDLDERLLRLETQVRERAEMQQKLDQLTVDRGALDQKIAVHQKKRDDLESHTSKRRSTVQTTLESLADAEDKARTAERELTTYRDAKELHELKRRAARVQEAFTQIEDANRELGANPATEDLVSAVTGAHTRVEVARAKLLAAAPKVSIHALGEQTIVVDAGEDTEEVLPGETMETEVPNYLGITVPGVLQVSVKAGSSLENLDEDARQAEVALESALRTVGATSAGEALSLGEKRRVAKSALEHATITYREFSDGLSHDDLKALIAEATGNLGEDAEEGRLEVLVGSDRVELESSAKEARLNCDRLGEKLKKARQNLELAQKGEATFAEEAITNGLAAQNFETQTKLLTEQLEALQNESDDKCLAGKRENLEEQREALRKRNGSVEQQLSQLDTAKITAELTNFQALVPSKEDELEEAKHREVVLGTQLDERTAEGLYDALQELLLQEVEARSMWRQLSSRAASANLLWTTLSRHKAAAQAEYVAPLETELDKLGKLVFGRSFGVQVGPELQIISRTLGGVTVSFDALSAGTQEQLALLGRLAVARLVDPDRSAPVILDDTLGFADPQRLENLNVVLNAAGKEAQVIVLTCQPERFSSVGGAKTVNLLS